ncbi:MAG: prephenate dehydratase [Acidimicrobiales bacterium]
MSDTTSGGAATRRIAYLGPEGTFTEQALRTQPDLRDEELLPMRTFVDVLNATQDGEVDLGFAAIENAIEGTVNVTLDTLAFDTHLLIQREVVLDIVMNLMAAPGTTLDDITVVHSHPVANAQCRSFLNAKLPGVAVEPANSTAAAAARAAKEPGVAALAPPLAGERYGLDVLASDIADINGNQTRFLLVAPEGVPAPTGHDKTTLVLFQRDDHPGSLVSILHEFSARNLNLTKLTSRPNRTTLGNYCFMVDVEGHIADDIMANCLRNIQAKHAEVKFLGSYPRAGNGSSAQREAATDAWSDAATWMDSLRSQIRD